MLRDPNKVKRLAVHYFRSLFSITARLFPIDEALIRSVMCGSVTDTQAQVLAMSIGTYEMKRAMFDLVRHKVPGQDGYNTELCISGCSG